MSLLTGGWQGGLDKKKGMNFKNSVLNARKARWAFKTGLTNVDDIRERKAMWTLRGWKETDEEGNEHMVAEEIPVPKEKQPSKEPESNNDEDQENNQNDKNVADDENADV